MLDDATPEARRALITAQSHAREHRHPYVGTEHLCCGLLSVDDGLSTMFAEHGASLPACLAALSELVDADGESVVYVPFTAAAKAAALGAGGEVRPLMRALLADGESGASMLLYAIGADVRTLRDALEPQPSALSTAVAGMESRLAEMEAELEDARRALATSDERTSILKEAGAELCAAIYAHRARAGEHVSPVDAELYTTMEGLRDVLAAGTHSD